MTDEEIQAIESIYAAKPDSIPARLVAVIRQLQEKVAEREEELESVFDRLKEAK